VDPHFVDPLVVDATASGQWARALQPWLVGGRFHLQAISQLVEFRSS